VLPGVVSRWNNVTNILWYNCFPCAYWSRVFSCQFQHVKKCNAHKSHFFSFRELQWGLEILEVKRRKQDFLLICALFSVFFCCIIVFNIAEKLREVEFRSEGKVYVRCLTPKLHLAVIEVIRNCISFLNPQKGQKFSYTSIGPICRWHIPSIFKDDLKIYILRSQRGDAKVWILVTSQMQTYLWLT